ncbi:hypothetical protein [Ralstonia sp. GP101]|uniref:hypothetical protein n=1 Tax=Ralstonia sp. GP101 TaxID=3035146 RepID=UPI0038921DC5
MSDLVKSVSIANLASQRAAVVERVRQALDLLGEAQKLASGAPIGFPRLVIDSSYSRRGTVCVTGDYAKRDEAETCILHTIDAGAGITCFRSRGCAP